MNYYDISCFRHHDKQHPSHMVYRLKFSGDDGEFPADETIENTALARKILIENREENSNAEKALTGYFTRFSVFKYSSYF